MTEEGELKKRSLTQRDMLELLRKKMRDSGYSHPDGTITPTAENIQIQIDYEYKARFVPIEVLDEAKTRMKNAKDFKSLRKEVVYWFGE